MSFKFCFVYPWATLGGVERVLLNRLIAFNDADLPIEVDLMFLHDSGGAEPLRYALKKMGFGARVIVAPDFTPEVAYDLVFCIDCPQAFELCERRNFRFLAECHTSYIDNRKYLRTLPANCEIVVTPSKLFSDRVRNELGELDAVEVVELRNFVPWDIRCDLNAFYLPGWVGKPILFFGRMDMHKDPIALLDAFSSLDREHPGRFICILCGPSSAEIDIAEEIRMRNLISKVVLLPPVPFNSAGVLLDMVKRKGGVFVSPSKGESFGLSAAEAICTGLPVILSDIEEHRLLVQGYEDRFTYQLGKIKSLAERITDAFDNYEPASEAVLEIRERISSKGFIEDWNVLLGKLNLQ